MYRPWQFGRRKEEQMPSEITLAADEHPRQQDLNDRGRGRTVETQSGGIAVLRAIWKLVESRQEQWLEG